LELLSMAWWSATREVLRYEWLLLTTHRKLAVAAVGLLFVPALYALIYLWGMWDPASHTRALPAGLVNLDTGATYRGRNLNMGAEVLDAIERHGQFSYRRYTDPADARRRVRQGELAFVLEVPADFSRQAVPGEAPARPSWPSTPRKATTTAAPALRAALRPRWRSG
jgi:putative membrane protein